MKKKNLVIILLALAMVTFIGKETYSYYIYRTTVNVTSTGSNVICDAEITNVTPEEKSKFGYSEFKVIVKNYDTSSNLSKEPFNYTLTVENNGGNNGEFAYNNVFDPNLEITGTLSNTEQQQASHIIQVKSTSGSSENVGYKVKVNCFQNN